ncbi:hypothetical protein [Fusibacillus kribbianus]|uniref:DUF3221 domain-containing protein n=1 Tax=Fusibacillus kribbianus TaxID=3044208 RepID=A0AAP4BD24_9FIRM|nr:hypothetical protein [Ruminococcus sp. YH-rum2234]MDI9243008.1 hypothetical protein [Ruminococcus sp. YH-rum2234]
MITGLKKKMLTALAIVIVLAFCGCGKKETDAGENGQIGEKFETGKEEVTDIKNGDLISREITGRVKLEAVVKLPEEGIANVEECQVQQVKFDGESMRTTVFPELALEGWIYDEQYDSHYWRSKENKDNAVIGSIISYNKERWYENRFCLPMREINGTYVVKDDEYTEELFFSSREEIAETAKTWLKERVGITEVGIERIYSITHQEMKKTEEQQYVENGTAGVGKPGESFELKTTWSEADDFYMIFLTRVINGLPLLTGDYVRQDEVYLPNGRITLCYAEEGPINIDIPWDYKILGRKTAKLCPMEMVYESLQRKFERTITADVLIDEMQLIYFPYPVDIEERVYDLIPAWKFSFSDYGMEKFVYINAIDGIEIIE